MKFRKKNWAKFCITTVLFYFFRRRCFRLKSRLKVINFLFFCAFKQSLSKKLLKHQTSLSKKKLLLSQPDGTTGCFVVVVGSVSGFLVVVVFWVCLVVVVFGVCLVVVGFGVGLAVVDLVTGEDVGFGVGRTLTSFKMQLTSDADTFSL